MLRLKLLLWDLSQSFFCLSLSRRYLVGVDLDQHNCRSGSSTVHARSIGSFLGP